MPEPLSYLIFSTYHRDMPNRVLFLCTGNYYRSRFAECLFNSAAGKIGLPWRARSGGLALERGAGNVGPIAASAARALQGLGIRTDACSRFPVAAVADDFEQADLIVALHQAEHRPLLQERFPAWADRVEYWHVEDAAEPLAHVEREVMGLMARLLGGGKAEAEDGPAPTPAEDTRTAPPQKGGARPVVRVGRETRGRRGKGVTTVSDLPLDEDGLRQLAARLKQRCGTGGTVKDGHIEIQGDHRERLVAELEDLGFRVKRTGG